LTQRVVVRRADPADTTDQAVIVKLLAERQRRVLASGIRMDEEAVGDERHVAAAPPNADRLIERLRHQLRRLARRHRESQDVA